MVHVGGVGLVLRLSMSEVLAYATAVALAVVFAASFRVHLREPERIDRIVRQLGMGRRTKTAVGIAQIIIIVTLVLAPRIGGLLAAAFIFLATARLSYQQIRYGNLQDCGCFRRQHALDVSFYARNVLLILMATAVFFWASVGWPEAAMAVAVTAAAGGSWIGRIRPVRLARRT